MSTRTRLCPFCKIQWQATAETRECPKCKAPAFFTMNAGDIGTTMQLDSAGLTIGDFVKWPDMQANNQAHLRERSVASERQVERVVRCLAEE